MEKRDYRKELRHLYGPSRKEVAVVEVPSMNFLMVDGAGDPNTAVAYKEAVAALFSVSYALKFMVKKRQGVDYGVMPLEGLWWTEDGKLGVPEDKGDFLWTMMIMQPPEVTAELVEEAVAQVEKKRPAGVERIRFEGFEEGRAAQIMHFGPFSTEGPTVERVNALIEARGGRLRGRHHEIYLSDLSRTAPDRLRTVIRHPFE